MNFNIINGNDDYLELADQFTEYYNNPKISVVEIKEKLKLNKNTYRKLLKYCKEQGMVKARYKYNKWDKRKNQKLEPLNYTKSINNGYTYWLVDKHINGKRKHFASFKHKKQAKRMVELLKECNWDYTKRYELKEQVLNES